MLIQRTLWHVETHLTGALTLAGIAAALGVTPAWLTRAFAQGTGQPLMRYLWRRRLTLAAQGLAAGKGSVLMVALDAGYASHEAFSRAFRAELGLTPRAVLARGHTRGLPLTPPMEIPMTTPTLAPPVIEEMPARRIVGPLARYDMQTRVAIPGQWSAYDAQGITPAGAVPDAWYGVCANFGAGGEFDYLCGQEVPHGTPPDGWQAITLPAGRWARFASSGHISTMQSAWSEIYSDWMGRPGLTPRDGPSAEYYPASFNGATGMGGWEIWLPVA